MSPFMRIFILFLVTGTAMLYKNLRELLSDLPAPEMALDQWWGKGERPKDWQAYITNTSQVVPESLHYSETIIDDLRSQLDRPLRLVEPLEGVSGEYGFNSRHLRKVIDYWRDEYLPRWRERESFLGRYDHFTTEIQGLRVHFIHVTVNDEEKVNRRHYPVILLHGWPGSVREFYSLIEKLRQNAMDPNNQYLFDIIVPSLPGYGWSESTTKPGLGPAEMAIIMRNLMLRLGYKEFFIQSGDWGSRIGSHMATFFPENVLGYHSNFCLNSSPKALLKGIFASLLPRLFAPPEFEHFFVPQFEKLKFLISESGYFHLQATKPDTIGHTLSDNPVGLAAYWLEKFSTFTNAKNLGRPDAGLTKSFELDALLDNLMIYYLTNSITTSQRLYAEAFAKREMELQLDRVPTQVPTACARFKHEIAHFLDCQLRDKYPNLIHSSYYDQGGHFAAMKLTDVLYGDFIGFVKKVEHFSKINI